MPDHESISGYPLDPRCHRCGEPLGVIDFIQHMPFNTGMAARSLWDASWSDHPLEDLRTAIAHIEFEITRHTAAQERVTAVEARQLPLLGEQDMEAFREEQAIAAAFAPEGRDDRMAWARRDCEPVPFMIALGSRTSVLRADGDLTVGMVTDAVATKAPFQLPEGHYTLAYSDNGQLRAVSRDVKVGELVREEGHESRRYIILTCT